MTSRKRQHLNRGSGQWRGLEPLEPRVLMSADGPALAAVPGPQSAAVVEDSPQVQDNVSQTERAYTVQYQESDFNFVARLLEEEGVFYFFEHEHGKHALVLADPQDAQANSQEGDHDAVQAASPVKTFSPGGKFKIQEHRSSSEAGRTYAVTSITHSATEPVAYETRSSATEDYLNVFTCIPDSVAFRPATVTPKPLVHEVGTSVVTGPSGEEIHADEFGRVKLQFHWDREGDTDENSSCWIRVSQVYALKSFGGIDIPRIGEEVLVGFEEGDPDRPIIIGHLYNGKDTPPYSLPGDKTATSLQSSSSPGGGGYNEIILDDTKGNEQVRVHGQFDVDSTLEHDLREHVLNDRSRDVTNNETITVGTDRTEDVGTNESLNVGSNLTPAVDKNETITVSLTRTHTVGINETITVGAAQQITVGATQTLSVGKTA